MELNGQNFQNNSTGNGNMNMNPGQNGMNQNPNMGMGNMPNGPAFNQRNAGNQSQGFGGVSFDNGVANNQMNMGGYSNGYNQNTNMYNQGYNGMQQPYKKPVLGLVSLILAILSVVICCFTPWLAIPAIIVGIIAIVKNKFDKKAIIGIVIAVIALISTIILNITIGGIGSVITDLIEKGTVAEDDYDYEDDYEYEDEDTDYEEDDDVVVDSEEVATEVEEDKDTPDDIKVSGDTNITTLGDSFVMNGQVLNLNVTKPADIWCDEVITDEEDLKLIINPNYYECITVSYKNYTAWYYFANFTEGAIPLSDCTLYKVYVENRKYYDGETLNDLGYTFNLGQGITENITYDELKAMLGEPDTVYDNSENYTEYKWNLDNYKYRLSLQLANDGVCGVTYGYY